MAEKNEDADSARGDDDRTEGSSEGAASKKKGGAKAKGDAKAKSDDVSAELTSVGNDEDEQEAAPVGAYTESESLFDRREETRFSSPDARLPDAWTASYGRAPGVETSGGSDQLFRVVIGRDERVRVTDTSEYPYRAICSLTITAADGTRFIGTGWFAGPRLIVTAAHCVYIHGHGGWVRSVDFFPGRSGSSAAGSRTATKFRALTQWTRWQRSESSRQPPSDYDLAAILVDGSSAPGEEVGYLGFGTRTESELRASTVAVSGYPGDKPTGTQWAQENRVSDVTDRRVVYQNDTFGGQSGAPVWVKSRDQRIAVAIHTGGNSSGNSGTRINEQVFQMLKQWKTESQSLS